MTNTSPNDKVPYTSPTWLDNFVIEIRKSPPTKKVDSKWVEDELGIKGANARSFARILRDLGLINPEGQLTPVGHALRRDTIDKVYINAAESVLRQTYPNLMEKVEQETDFNITKVRSHFMDTNTKLGQSAITQAVATFRWWLTQAQHQDLEQKIWGTTTEARLPAEVLIKKREPIAPKRQVKLPPSEPQKESTAATRLSALSSILRINIDSTWDDERLRQIFRRLDRLLKGEEQDE